jgi:ZIP family zinc transporter
MLAATAFSLLVPSLDIGGPWVAVLGLLIGAIVLHLIDRFIPHSSPAFGS